MNPFFWVCVGLTILWLCSLRDDEAAPLTTLFALLAWGAYLVLWLGR